MSELPKGWASVKFTELLDVNGGTQPPKKEFIFEPKEGYIRLLQIRDFGKKPVPTYIPDNGKRRTCKKDDILIGRYGASVGRICTGMEGAYNVALARVAKPDDIDSRYLKYFLLSDFFQQPLSMLSRSAQNGFNKQDLSEFDFFVPPQKEQIRIANKLDSLLAKVDAAQARLDKIPTILKRFRQSVLVAATSGELTKEWREENIELLDNEYLSYSITEYDDRDLAELPPSWCFTSFKDAAYIKSNLVDPLKTPDAIHLAPNHIESNSGRIIEISTVEKDSVKSNKHQFYSGQIIYSKIRPYLNKVSLVNFDGLCSADMYPIEAKISSGYLHLYMLSEQFVFWTSQQQGRVVLPKINQKALNRIPVPVPSTLEQKEISRRVESLFSMADIVEKQYQKARKRISRLTQSILAKAFRGELVPQEATDESAELLLNRIKQEQEKAASESKTKKKTTRKPRAKAPKRNAAMTKTRFDDDVRHKGYLAEILKKSESNQSADELFQKSQLPIEDFYKQLAWEIDNGCLLENKDGLEAA